MQTGLRTTKAFGFFCAVACLCFFTGCKEEKKPATSSDTSSGNPVTAPADYLGAIGKAPKSAQKTLGGVGLDQAIKTFSVQEGRNPKSLDELVEKGIIPAIPKPPAGMKYEYDSATAVLKLVPE